MKRNREWWFRIGASAALLLLAGVLVATLFNPHPLKVEAQERATASQAPPATAPRAASAMPRSITVVGSGQVKIKPDIAQINVGIQVVGDTVKAASSQGAGTMAAVMQALKAQGVAEQDMQTSGYSVWVERPYGPNGPDLDKASIYHVSNTVNVTIRQPDKVGAILDAAIEAGANNIYGVNFSLAESGQLMAEARKKAAGDAQSKATELANMHQVTLGEVISVSEVIGGGGGGYFPGYNQLGGGAGGMGGGGPISPGELQMTVQLQVTYAIQ